MLEGGTGYLKVAEFRPATADEVRGRAGVAAPRRRARLVLDLRGVA